MEEIYVENTLDFFNTNQPSIIDLYTEDELTFTKIRYNISKSRFKNHIKCNQIEENICKVTFDYKDNLFDIYLSIIENKEDISDINSVLTSEKVINLANQSKSYVKSYIKSDHDYVEAYYAQIKLLAIISDKPLLIVDCSQWCIFSALYLKQFLENDVDIIDSNLFKIKIDDETTLYTEGLSRFGIKELQMVNVDSEHLKMSANILSRLGRYYIENGQIYNTCQEYPQIFEESFYVCLVNIEDILDDLIKFDFIKPSRMKYLNSNFLIVSLQIDDNNDNIYESNIEVFNHLSTNITYYTSEKHFIDEKQLAQNTLLNTISYLSEEELEKDLMIFARKEDITTDWYNFVKYYDGFLVLRNIDEIIEIKLEDVINWNYRGVFPLYAYSLIK